MSALPKRRKAERMGVREEPQIRCPSHLAWIRGNCCSIDGKAGHVCGGKIEAAHVRNGTDCGTGLKPSDTWAIPLCSDAHRLQHQVGEAAFQKIFGIDMKSTAAGLAAISPHRHKWEPNYEDRPSPSQILFQQNFRAVLGKVTSVADAERNYRELAKQFHPDRPGGSHRKMAELNKAIEQARKALA